MEGCIDRTHLANSTPAVGFFVPFRGNLTSEIIPTMLLPYLFTNFSAVS